MQLEQLVKVMCRLCVELSFVLDQDRVELVKTCHHLCLRDLLDANIRVVTIRPPDELAGRRLKAIERLAFGRNIYRMRNVVTLISEAFIEQCEFQVLRE